MPLLPRPVDVFAAARRIAAVARRTPLRRSPGLSAKAGGDVYLKLENEQVGGSFKIRGAYNTLAALAPSERARGIVAASAGNHGMGVAYASREFGVPATIYVPATAPAVKKEGIAALGATVHDGSPDYDAAHAAAVRAARERGVTFVDPCVGPLLVAGTGTVALEALSDLPEMASIVVCVGGGGLVGGIGSFLRAVAPHVRVIGAQTTNTAAMARSIEAGRVVPFPNLPTLADGLAGDVDGDALEIARLVIDAMVLVTEEELARAIAWLAREENAVVEGAGAAAVAAILADRIPDLPTPAVVTVSGGNIDRDRHAELLAQQPKYEARNTKPAPGSF